VSDLRILESITSSKLGGADVVVVGLCRSLAQMGAHVQIFCPSGRPVARLAAAHGIENVSWKTHGKVDPVTVVRLARLMRKSRAHVIHTHLSTASLLGALAAKLAARPSVAHVHGMNSALCFRYSTVVVAVSEAVKRHLCAQGLDEKKVHVVHNGVDITEFRPLDAADRKLRFVRSAEAPLFAVLGRLSSEKGQRVALEAMPILLRDYPEARLLIVGEGADSQTLKTTANSLGISKSVEFTGFIPDVRDMMIASDAVIVPSLKEGFGLVAIEAMAVARPVVAAAVGGLDEVVVHGETGMIVPPNDPYALAQALKDLAGDRALAERMGRRGRERVEDCFELGKQTRLLLSILQETI